MILFVRMLVLAALIAVNAVADDRVVTDLLYVDGGDARFQSLDLYLPEDDSVDMPLIMFVHGGAWVSGDKDEHKNIGEAFTGKGLAVALINYRLSSARRSDAAVHPAHVRDAAAAFAWLRQAADSYPYDGDRIIIMGHSAGAHIAGLLALDGRFLAAVDEKPQAAAGFIGIEGIYDLPKLVDQAPSYRRRFVAPAFGEDESAWAAASPSRLDGENSPPWLIVHSPRDRLVHIDQSRIFADHLRKLGTPHSLYTKERHRHFAMVDQIGHITDRTTRRILAFVANVCRNHE